MIQISCIHSFIHLPIKNGYCCIPCATFSSGLLKHIDREPILFVSYLPLGIVFPVNYIYYEGRTMFVLFLLICLAPDNATFKQLID